AGVVVTGGGSMVPGTAELAYEVLGVEARVGYPMGLAGGLVEKVSDPQYATAVGLVLFALQPELRGGAALSGGMVAHPSENGVPGDTLVTRIATRMKTWFDEL
ncbi:MAG: cell division protein FtsA, partial [Rhodothermales bacterium]|nr:cell division protein FtsA [Rhodothermales bacterium]